MSWQLRLGSLRGPIDPVASGGGFSPEATQFFARITDPGTTRKNLYAAMIDGLVSDGVWAKQDGLYILAADISANSLVNLKSSSFNLTGVNGTNRTFTADQGWVSTGSQLDSGYIPSTSGGNMTQNSAHTFSYCQTAAHATGGPHYGCANGAYTNVIQFDPFIASTNPEVALNDGKRSAAVSATSKGSWVNSRTGASATFLRLNAAAFDTSTQASTGLPDCSFCVIGSQQGAGGYFGSASSDQISAVSFGSSLTTTQADALSNRVNTYMAGLPTPKNVY